MFSIRHYRCGLAGHPSLVREAMRFVKAIYRTQRRPVRIARIPLISPDSVYRSEGGKRAFYRRDDLRADIRPATFNRPARAPARFGFSIIRDSRDPKYLPSLLPYQLGPTSEYSTDWAHKSYVALLRIRPTSGPARNTVSPILSGPEIVRVRQF